jgi:putative transposase
VRYINKTYHRTGTLWDSRYKSSLVQEVTSLLLCQRYIELNPVRAALVDDPAHCRWSSYPANALGQRDLLITPHPLYTALAANETSRRVGQADTILTGSSCHRAGLRRK